MRVCIYARRVPVLTTLFPCLSPATLLFLGAPSPRPHTHTTLTPPQALHPLFAATENDGVRDNALGCVARLLTAAADPAAPPPAGPSAAAAGLLPLEAVLPVFLGALPLREDLSEAGAVYGALCALMTGACVCFGWVGRRKLGGEKGELGNGGKKGGKAGKGWCVVPA